MEKMFYQSDYPEFTVLLDRIRILFYDCSCNWIYIFDWTFSSV